MEDRNRVVQAEQQRLRRKKEALKKKKEKKANTKKSIFKIFLFLITFILVFIFYDGNFSIDTSGVHLPTFKLPSFDFLKPSKNKNHNTPDKVKEKDGAVVHNEITNSLNGKKIAFVPMDDLPLHSSWISTLMSSANYKVEMPEAKYYRTQLGDSVNSYAGFTTTFGNPQKIASWLLDMEEEGCNYYVISLDQLFSGGLIPSTYATDEDFNSYSGDYKTVKSTLEKIINNKENHVYLIDTITGLTVEKNYMDISDDDSLLLLEYSKKNRKRLDESELTLKSIKESYTLDSNGSTIETTLDNKKLERYLGARERKLRLYSSIATMISKSPNKNNIHIFYSYEGNITENSIQTNDIIFVENTLEKQKIDYVILPNNDSIDKAILTKLYTDNISNSLTVSVHYFGNEDTLIKSSSYTYKDYMDELLKDLSITTSDKGYIDILIYTKCDDITKREENAKSLINQYISNIKKHIPTIIINDATTSEDEVLINQLKSKNYIGYMIGYSNNNGFINSSRLSLFEGLTRYLYLTNSDKKDKADNNYLKSLSFTLINDMIYLNHPVYEANVNILDSEMFNNTEELLSSLEKSNYISNLINYEESGIKSVKIYNYKFPWNRTNEINFVVSISIGQEKEISFDK